MPDFGALTIKLVLFAIPGLIASRIYRKLKGRRPRQSWEDFVEILIFTALSYGLAALATWGWYYLDICWHTVTKNNEFVANPRHVFLVDMFDNDAPIKWGQIWWTVPVGVLLGFLAAGAERYQWVYLLGKRLGVVAGGGDYEEWLEFNNDQTSGKWVYVYDHETSIIYVAGIDTFSRWANIRGEYELILEKVSAYHSETGKELGRFEYVYLCREAKAFTIWLPQQEPPFPLTQDIVDRQGKITDNDSERSVAHEKDS